MQDKRIKVLLVSPYSAKKVGGIGTWSKSIIEFAPKRESINLRFQNTKFFLKHNAVRKESPLERFVVGSLDTASILLKLLWNLMVFRPDIVHYTSSASWSLHKDRIAIFLTKKLFSKKFVIHWHFGRVPQICHDKGFEYYNLMKVLRAADASIVIDGGSYRALLSEGFTNISYIPNPITQAVYDSSINLNTEEINRNRQCGTVVFVGHIEAKKGVYELVNACLQVPDVNTLYLIGPCAPEIKQDLINLAQTKDNGKWLVFTGELQRESVFEYYQKCSVFCLPSYTEGFPYVILEAMANATPIVATTVGAIPEMISDGCGLCIEPQNEQQVKDALAKLLSERNYALEMGIKAHNRLLSNYTIEKLSDQYLSVWKDTLM